MTLLRSIAIFAAILASLPSGVGASQAPAVEDAAALRAIARDAYVWGYPMVDLQAILAAQVIDPASPEYKGPLNAIGHVRNVATPADRAVIAPNVDTPYSYAWLDLRREPVVIEVPAFDDGRYVAVQLFDAYTWILGYISPRTNGRKGGRFLVAGPDWAGATPAGIDGVFRSPTTLALAMVRTQLLGPGDLPNVHAVQDGFRVQGLSAALGRTPPAVPAWLPPPAPLDLRASPTDPRFFDVLAWMMTFAPALPEEQALRERFARIGLRDGHYAPPAGSEAAIAEGMAEGLAVMRAGVGQIRSSAEIFGSREQLGTDYLKRALGAMLGILGNSAEEYLGVGYQSDAAGQPFDGGKRYTIRFTPETLPPVGAFWSITVYGADRLLYANAIDRQVINSPMLPSLQREADGSIVLYLQHDDPGEPRRTNWLPVPKGPFVLTFRTYQPSQAIRDGRWRAPPVVPEG